MDAAKSLIWERGVEATSPRRLLAAADVGQGSLYHHFPGKEDWALAAIRSLADDLGADADAALAGPDRRGIDRIRAYLTRPRTALDGCRLGRLGYDPGVRGNAELEAPVGAFFVRLHALLASAAADAIDEGDLDAALDPDAIADAVAAVVQGGYVLARARDDERALGRAVDGFLALLGPRTDAAR